MKIFRIFLLLFLLICGCEEKPTILSGEILITLNTGLTYTIYPENIDTIWFVADENHIYIRTKNNDDKFISLNIKRELLKSVKARGKFEELWFPVFSWKKIPEDSLCFSLFTHKEKPTLTDFDRKVGIVYKNDFSDKWTDLIRNI